MRIKTKAPQQIALILCKDFPELVRRVECQEPLFPEAFLSFVNGFVNWTGGTGMTMLPAESEQFIATTAANGYTVTAYVRLPDLHAFVPFTGKAEMLAAAAANQKILGKPRTEIQSNRVVLG